MARTTSKKNIESAEFCRQKKAIIDDKKQLGVENYIGSKKKEDNENLGKNIKAKDEKQQISKSTIADCSKTMFIERLKEKKDLLIKKLKENLAKEIEKIPKELLEINMLTIDECIRENHFEENFKIIKKEEIKKKQSLAVQIGEQSFLFNGEDFELEENNIKDENIIKLLDNVKEVFKRHL